MPKNTYHHLPVYMPDGNIVVSASLPDGKLEYHRVHKSILAMHSPVFEDMFALPDGPGFDNQVHGTYEGVPLVHLPDNAHGVALLLEAIYDPSIIQIMVNKINRNMMDLAPVFELARKYECDRLERGLASFLREDWPKTLQEWEVHEAKVEVYATYTTDDSGTFVDDRFPEPASAIRIAQDFDIPEIIPAAFYHLTRIEPEMDWDRAREKMYGDDKAASYFSDNLYDGKHSARWALLSGTDWLCLTRGKSRLRYIACQSDIFRYLFRKIQDHSCRAEHCRQARLAARKAVIHEIRDSAPAEDELDILKTIRSVRKRSGDGELPQLRGMCSSCRYALDEEAQIICERLWRLLPDLFFKDEFMDLDRYPFVASDNY